MECLFYSYFEVWLYGFVAAVIWLLRVICGHIIIIVAAILWSLCVSTYFVAYAKNWNKKHSNAAYKLLTPEFS